MVTPFELRVYEVVKRIPRGKVSTYGEVARALESRAFRAVGSALRKNPFAPVVPCHRVVSASGGLGGFAHGVSAKVRLLHEEGVEVENERIDLEKFGIKLRREGREAPV